MGKTVYNNIDEYINVLEPLKQSRLLEIRNIVLNNYPDAVELISYNIPAFKLNGKILLYYAAFKNHVSIFPAPRNIDEFAAELINYKGGKGTIQFSDFHPMPINLIERIIAYRAIRVFEKKNLG